MKITFLGHAALCVEGKKKLLFDPFLTGNPLAAVKADELSPDYILLSHGHGDHFGDAIPIAKRCGATIVAPNELAAYCTSRGINSHHMYMGGHLRCDDDLAIHVTNALHGSALIENGIAQYLGVAVGFLVMMEGKTIYYAGDTDLFYDMKAVIGDRYEIDLAVLPIGSTFTMDPDEALTAVGWLGAKRVLPVHYNTFPNIVQDVDDFKTRVERTYQGVEVCPLAPGESLTL